MSIDELPLITCRAAWTDDDVNFHSDITYFRALRHDIRELASEKKFANPFPITLSDELTRIEQLAKKDFDHVTNMVKKLTW
jgi:hypothetical protein